MLVSCCITCTGTNRNSFIGGESLMFIGVVFSTRELKLTLNYCVCF